MCMRTFLTFDYSCVQSASRPTTREGQGGRNRVPSSGRQAARHLLQDAGGAQAASSVEVHNDAQAYMSMQ